MNYNLSIGAEQTGQASYSGAVDGLRTQIRQLIEAVAGSDADSAKAAFDRLAQHPAAGGEGPLKRLLDTLNEPLSDRDIGAAREALAKLRDSVPPRPGSENEERPIRHEADKVRAAIRNLIEALRGGEIDDAQLAYAQLIELSDVQEHGLNGPFGDLLAGIGEALTAGDKDAANTLFAGFAGRLDPGTALDVQA